MANLVHKVDEAPRGPLVSGSEVKGGEGTRHGVRDRRFHSRVPHLPPRLVAHLVPGRGAGAAVDHGAGAGNQPVGLTQALLLDPTHRALKAPPGGISKVWQDGTPGYALTCSS